MRHRRPILVMAVVVAIALGTALVLRRGDKQQPAVSSAPAAPRAAGSVNCAAMWRAGVELQGGVDGRETQGYFDMAPVEGTADRVSGVVVFPGERKGRALADTPIGLQGSLREDGCQLELNERDGDANGAVWQLRIENSKHIEGTRRTPKGDAESALFTIVPDTRCDGAGEWRTFRSPQWPVTFDYPANWVVTDDGDDVNIECPSVKTLAAGGSFLTFERGRFEPAGTDEPYWFVRVANDDWRISDVGCGGRSGEPHTRIRCAPARRSQRNGMTVLQGAAGEHRLYRPGIGYLGEGSGITRYLFVLGERWISLDSAAGNQHYDDIGNSGGAVLLEGEAVGERVVRSIKPR